MLNSVVLPYQGLLLAGTDEAGRGPLAGSVVAAAVILHENQVIAGLDDSKKLSEKKREALFDDIQQKAKAFAIASSSVEEIDQLNILQASLLAMKRAVEALPIRPEFVAVDGNRLPVWSYPSQAVVQGDSRVAAIAAASILAKVTRDRELLLLHEQWPEYGFAQHKGYPTAAHLSALQRFGVSPVHRKSYKPVKAFLNEENV